MGVINSGLFLAASAGEIIGGGAKKACEPNCGPSLGSVIQIGANSLLGIAAAVAVLFVIIGGIRLTMSQGDPGVVVKAKNSILYAIIGLVVTIVAFAIVNFVVNQLT